MKKIILVLCTAWLAWTSLAAEEWNTDLATARTRATKEKKLVLVNFTGSDWCSWCKRLQREVFATKEFGDYAKDNLMLVEIDFPSQKKQSESLKKANEALKDRYKVNGFPTIVVLDGAGKEVWRQVGYLEGGAKGWISRIRALKKE